MFWNAHFVLKTGLSSPGEITCAFRDFLEKIIREEPHNYLWTHRRWKWDYKEEYKENWIDSVARV
jgi:KDO2-lipid IV(A) lauroyltransferase